MAERITIEVVVANAAQAEAAMSGISASVESVGASAAVTSREVEAAAVANSTYVMTSEDIRADAAAMAASMRAKGAVFQRDLVTTEEITAAEQAYNASLAQTVVETEAVAAASTAKAVPGLGRLNQSLVGAIDRTGLLSPAMGHLSYSLGAFAVGAATMLPILAGFAALSMLLEKIRDRSKEAKQEAEQARKAFEETARAAAEGPGGQTARGISDAEKRLADVRAQIAKEQQAVYRAGAFAQGTPEGSRGRALLAAEIQRLNDLYAKEAELTAGIEANRKKLNEETARGATQAEVAAARTASRFSTMYEAEQKALATQRDLSDQLAMLEARIARADPKSKLFYDLQKQIDDTRERLVAAANEVRTLKSEVASGVSSFLGGTSLGLPGMPGISTVSGVPRPGAVGLSPANQARAQISAILEPVSTQTMAFLREFAAGARSVGLTLHQIEASNAPAMSVLREAATKAGMSVEKFAASLGITVDASTKASGTVIAAFGAMAQAAILGSQNMAQAVINAFTQIAQAEASKSGGGIFGFLGNLGVPIIGAVGGILSAVVSRHRSAPAPVTIASYDPKALDQQKEAMKDTGPRTVTVQVISPTTGEILKETEYQLRRREARDAITRLPKGSYL